MHNPGVPGVERIGKSRLEAMSDGIFAFAMTLLVITIAIPEVPWDQAPELLPAKIAGLHSQFLLFVIAFFILAAYWMSHHRILARVEFVDGILIRINILVLFFIVLIPFTTSLSGDYTNVLEAVLLFHLNLLLASLALTGMWAYICRYSDTLAPGSKRPARMGIERAVVMPGVILVAIGVSFIDTYASMWCYALLPFLLFLAESARKLREKRTERRV